MANSASARTLTEWFFAMIAAPSLDSLALAWYIVKGHNANANSTSIMDTISFCKKEDANS